MSENKRAAGAKSAANEEFISILKNVTIFAGFSEKALHRVFSHCPIIEKKAGETIVEEGRTASEIYIILQGKVSIVLDIKSDPFELAVFGPGDVIGEASVIGVQKHSATAIAKEITELLVLTRTMLMEIYDRDKGTFSMLILNIARELARRLHRTDQVLLHYGKK
jgi:CRP/FNR family transcriptional regulator, cyclic AMP receptor protein